MTSFEQQLKMFDTMNFYISKGQTGTPAEFAALLCIQLPTFYTHLRYMRKKLKNEKISILYDHSEKTYIYSRPGSFTIGWTWAAAS